MSSRPRYKPWFAIRRLPFITADYMEWMISPGRPIPILGTPESAALAEKIKAEAQPKEGDFWEVRITATHELHREIESKRKQGHE